MANPSIYINEIYGPVFQGEGSSIGRRCMVVRLAGCNLSCSFCDSAYTWRFKDNHPHVDNKIYNKKYEVQKMSIPDLYYQITKNIDMIMVTGGEPLLQQRALIHLIKTAPPGWNKYIEFETAGTISPDKLIMTLGDTLNTYQFNVSPKLESSGNPLNKRRNNEALLEFANLTDDDQAIFKFVVSASNTKNYKLDIQEIRELCYANSIPPHKVYLMPEGTTVEKILKGTRDLETVANKYGWNISTRLHVLLHGNERMI